jgi:hypothetical protein
MAEKSQDILLSLAELDFLKQKYQTVQDEFNNLKKSHIEKISITELQLLNSFIKKYPHIYCIMYVECGKFKVVEYFLNVDEAFRIKNRYPDVSYSIEEACDPITDTVITQEKKFFVSVKKSTDMSNSDLISLIKKNNSKL